MLRTPEVIDAGGGTSNPDHHSFWVTVTYYSSVVTGFIVSVFGPKYGVRTTKYYYYYVLLRT